MAFTLYSDLQARMISELGMCPSQIIQQELQRSGVKFFKDSGCWRYLMAPLDVVAGQTSYALVIPTGAQLWQIYEVRVITDPTQIFDQVWPVQSTAYYCTDDANLLFYSNTAPTVSVSQGMRIELQLFPTWDSTGVPGNLINRYAEGIMAGAKMELMKMPKKPWTDMGIAKYNADIYHAELQEARRDQDVQGRRVSAMAKMRDFT